MNTFEVAGVTKEVDEAELADEVSRLSSLNDVHDPTVGHESLTSSMKASTSESVAELSRRHEQAHRVLSLAPGNPCDTREYRIGGTAVQPASRRHKHWIYISIGTIIPTRRHHSLCPPPQHPVARQPIIWIQIGCPGRHELTRS